MVNMVCARLRQGCRSRPKEFPDLLSSEDTMEEQSSKAISCTLEQAVAKVELPYSEAVESLIVLPER